MKKKIIIYGGSSYISRELIKCFEKDDVYFIIFCRKKDEILKFFQDTKIDSKSFKIFEVDLLDLNSNIEIIEKFNKDIDGLIWISGLTGDPILEFNNTTLESNELVVGGFVINIGNEITKPQETDTMIFIVKILVILITCKLIEGSSTGNNKYFIIISE